MRSIFTTLLFFMIQYPLHSQSQFTIHPGLYTLGTADKPTSEQLVNLPFIDGVVIRTKWEAVEIQPDLFNWTYIDSEILNAKKFGKKSVIQILGNPSWLWDSLSVKTYQYVDLNEYHPTFGDTLYDVISWDPLYLQRVEQVIVKLAEKYSTDTNVVSINAVSGNISRNLPEKIADGRNFWEAYNYHPDTLVAKLRRVLDVYMKAFPTTPLWSSMDYVSFETKASGKSRNYVCGEYAKYGVTKYPDRFGLWREDISGCTVYPPNVGSQWNVMNLYTERTGAQMLWHVQDGPARMNQCGISDTAKSGVMKAALEKGRKFGIRYFEIYGSDVKDTSLHKVFTSFAELLRSPVTNIAEQNRTSRTQSFTLFQNFPNPFNPVTSIGFILDRSGMTTVKVYDATGKEITTLVNEYVISGVFHQRQFNAAMFASGTYFIRLFSNNSVQTKKLLLVK